MYILKSAITKDKDTSSRWYDMDIGNMTLKDIFLQFKGAFATLVNNITNETIVFDVFTLRTNNYFSLITFNEYLTNLGDTALVASTVYPTLKYSYVKYTDIFHAGYTVTPIFPNAASDVQLPESERTAAKLTKANLDPLEFYKYCMVTVNGYFHLIDADATGIYVIDANTSRKTAKNNQIGIYSFKDIGAITYIPITSSMIVKQNDNIPMSNRCYIKLPQAIGNKTPIISIGGYLHVLDSSVYKQINDDTLCIDLLNMNLYERIYESEEYINLDSLGLTEYITNPSLIDRTELLSDEVISKYLSLSQSFVVLVDNVNIFTDRLHLHSTKGPGMLATSRNPDMPLMSGHGRMCDYWYSYEDGVYSISCFDNLRNNRVFRTTGTDTLPGLTDNRVPTHRQTVAHSYFFEIGTDVTQ